MIFRAILLLLIGLNLTACVTFPTPESAQVKILWENSVAIENCTYKGTVIGSQGHFYDYWLHSDRDMVWGTLNELRIKSHALGADTVYLYQPLKFLGSVTMMGNAYQCAETQSSEAKASEDKASDALDSTSLPSQMNSASSQ
ncbi:DUF4156 domain-containing protein [Shewanella sp. GD03713]|uniref:DUF4156 domain-containing protein n=1 Tax=Shewanella sp. GD03713 TaxID=2975372 RepID=UPI002449EE51|nr:DUF4156 domain-containing protein [Shewanella sp. GD03713]MDH1468846.1 DUF4156 domain-containing protein [Shewanella sp. GD03713]